MNKISGPQHNPALSKISEPQHLFCCFTSQVNSYGHGRTVSSPNHTFLLGKLEQAVNKYFVHILLLVTDNNLSLIQGTEGE